MAGRGGIVALFLALFVGFAPLVVADVLGVGGDTDLDPDMLPLSYEQILAYDPPVKAVPVVTEEMITEAKKSPDRFGLNVAFEDGPVDLMQSATILTVSGGGILFLLGLESKGALSIGIEFEKLKFQVGSFLEIRGSEGGVLHLKPGDLRPNRINYNFSTDLLSGHMVYLQFFVGSISIQEARISALVHDFLGYGLSEKKAFCDDNILCSVDSSCYPDTLKDQKNGAVKLTISGSFCSGVLMADPEQERVLILTATHCLGDNYENAKVFFNEKRDCQPNSIVGPCEKVGQQIVGLEPVFVAKEDEGDVALMKFLGDQNKVAQMILLLDGGPGYYNGWSLLPGLLTYPIATISNPKGDFQKISIAETNKNGDLAPELFLNFTLHEGPWDVGTVAGGSSGAGVFSISDGLVYGVISAGDGCSKATPCWFTEYSSSCSADEVYTVFGSLGLEVSFPQGLSLPLMDVLAPSSPGITTFQGSYCPFGQNCDDWMQSLLIPPPPCLKDVGGGRRRLRASLADLTEIDDTDTDETDSDDDDDDNNDNVSQTDCIIAIPSPSPVPSPAPEDSPSDCMDAGSGDVNMDATVNVLDVVKVINYIIGAGESNDLTICQMQAANLQDDGMTGTIDILDVVAILNLVIGDTGSG